MDESGEGVNTVLPLYFYELFDDARGGTDAPKFKGFGANDLTKMLPKDRRLQALIILYEIGSKLDAADKHFNEPGHRFTDPFIENAIVRFSAETGLPEEDVRRVLHRQHWRAAAVVDAPAPPAEQIANLGVVDP